MIRKQSLKFFLIALLMWFAIPGIGFAQFEPSSVTINDLSTGDGSTHAIPHGGVSATVGPTHEDTTGYDIQKYVYKWSTASAPLGLTDLGPGAPSVLPGDTITIVEDADTFKGSDDDTWYLHVKTVYFSQGAGTQISSDQVSAGVTFDDVAPIGSIALADNDTQAGNTSTSTHLTLRVSADADARNVYLNTQDEPSSAQSFEYAGTLNFQVAGEGTHTIFAWFEDEIHNRSTDPATLQVTVTAGKTVEPGGDMDLAVGDIRAFQVLGASDTELFDWSLVDADGSAISGDAPAEFVGAASGVATVQVKGEIEGATFKVKAESTGGEGVYESGRITVQSPSTIVKEYTLIKNNENTSYNSISIPFEIDGLNKVSDLYAAVPNCDGIQWWDAATQSYKAYSPLIPPTNIDISVGAVFFVSISEKQTSPVRFEGTEVSISFSLKKNDNNTSYNSISIPYNTNAERVADIYGDISSCDGIQWWDAGTQSYKSYSPLIPPTNIEIVEGDCLFVSVTSDVIWP